MTILALLQDRSISGFNCLEFPIETLTRAVRRWLVGGVEGCLDSLVNLPAEGSLLCDLGTIVRPQISRCASLREKACENFHHGRADRPFDFDCMALLDPFICGYQAIALLDHGAPVEHKVTIRKLVCARRRFGPQTSAAKS